MADGLTRSEKLVADLCERAFLRLWTHPNPKGKKGKELCDCLIVCGPHIVIISVKENQYQDTGNETGWKRWKKVALDKSFDQIHGAKRWLDTVERVERADGRVISLPPLASRQYHRVAIALGANGQVPVEWGDGGHGFVHACDERGVLALFDTLDTISDFVNFLQAVECLIDAGILPLMSGGGIEDLLALYLVNDRSFTPLIEKGADLLIIEGDMWTGLVKSGELEKMHIELKTSYLWDRLIDQYVDDLLTEGMFDMHSKEVTTNELALVAMALQPRSYRSALADAFIGWMENTEVRARVAQGYEDTAFVFLAESSADREFRSRELGLRCLVVRGIVPGVKTVVGIATDRPGTSKIGYSSDIFYMHLPNWSNEDQERVHKIQGELGYFKGLAKQKA